MHLRGEEGAVLGCPEPPRGFNWRVPQTGPLTAPSLAKREKIEKKNRPPMAGNPDPKIPSGFGLPWTSTGFQLGGPSNRSPVACNDRGGRKFCLVGRKIGWKSCPENTVAALPAEKKARNSGRFLPHFLNIATFCGGETLLVARVMCNVICLSSLQ